MKTTMNHLLEFFNDVLGVLDTVPDAQFNISHWQSKNACGTVACAIGWCGLNPEFAKKYQLQMATGVPIFKYAYAGFQAIRYAMGLPPQPEGYFGLDHWLFHGSSYPCDMEGVAPVKERIKELIVILQENLGAPARMSLEMRADLDWLRANPDKPYI